MKKQLTIGLLAAGFMLNAGALLANGTAPAAPAAEGVEISGNVDTIAAFGMDSSNSGVLAGTPVGGLADVAPGVVAASGKEFRFVVDQVEIDLAKSFGENIRLRADVDVIDFLNTGSRAGNPVDLEQGYITANISAGNGIELLIGKFNAPVGVESVDRNQNWLVTYGPNFRYLTPTNVTGIKIYYSFSDLVDLHFALVNSLNSIGFGNSSYPSALYRLGFNWGDEGNKSTFGISAGIGPEAGDAAGTVNEGLSNLDYFGDLDAMVALSDTWNLALEATYRVSDDGVADGTQSAMAGTLAVNYEASDVWDITVRASIHDEIGAGNGSSINGAGAGFGPYQGMALSGSLGAGYAIADGAKMKLEYRFDMDSTKAAGVANPSHHAALAEFAYTF